MKKNPRVLLVKPVTPQNLILNVVPPIGLGYLATALRKAGFKQVAILDCLKENLDFVAFNKRIKSYNPDIVGFQVFSHDLSSLEISLKIIKKINPKIITLAGGPHPSGFPQQTLETLPLLDYAFKGEAEVGLPLLIRKLSVKKGNLFRIPGLIYRQGRKIVVNPQIFPGNLDSLGFPAWDLIDPREYPNAPQGVFFKNLPVAPLMATRGCPFLCTFCAGRTITGLKVRPRSIGYILSEIKFLKEKYGVREIHFLDDNFTLNRSYVREFCQKLLKSNLNISWCCPNGVRLDTLDLEVLKLMKASGCYYVSVGIESGSNRILKLMKKKLTVEKIKRQIKMIKKSGITVNGFFILGYPGETKKEMEATIKLSRSLGLTRVAFYNFLPLPGTEIYEQLARNGEIEEDMDFSHIFQAETPYSPVSVSQKELKKIQQKAYLLFYLRPVILWQMLREIKTPNQFKYILKRAIAYLGLTI